MPNIFALRKVIPTRLTSSSTGGEPLNSTLDGALFTQDWYAGRIIEGRGYHVSIGAVSTPIQGGGAGTVFDAEQSEGVLSIPSGTTIIPFRIHVQTQAPLIAADNDETEILIAVDRTAVSTASGSTGTAETIFNLRTDLGSTGSLVTAISANTSDHNTPTLGIELAGMHANADVQGTAATALWNRFDLLYEPKVPPMIAGPAALYIYWFGTVATTGFAQVQWIEIPTPPTS